MADKDLKFETRFSRSSGWGPVVAGIIGLLIIVGIVLTMTTGLADRLLPMQDSYLDVLVPSAPDGSEALSLRSLTQKSDKTSLAVEGTVANRTDAPITGLSAVIEFKDKYTLPFQTITVAVEPSPLDRGAVGAFRATAMAGANGLGGYSLQFRLPDEGPFVPHKDERPVEPTLELNAK